MSTQHWKGGTIPGPGDDLLASWPTLLDTVGVYTPAASIAAARAVLADAISKGAAVTPAAPVAFLVGSGAQRVLYIADGTKNGSGAYVLSPINERELVSTPCTDTSTYTYASGLGARVIATSTLGIRPYDRIVEVDGCAYGSVAGSVDLGIHIGTKKRYVRFSTGQNTQALHLTAKVPAGTDPGISLVVYPRLSGSSIALSGATDYVGLDVAASPVTMA